MLKNYMIVAFRNFTKQPIYSAINISGLAIGVACSFLIFLYVWNELSYDTYHQDADRIYRVTKTFIQETGREDDAGTPFPLAEALLLEFPEIVENAVRFNNQGGETLALANSETREYVREESFFFVDGSVFNIFDINLLRGNPETALMEPNTVVLSADAAKKYFSEEDPIGKSMKFEGRFDLTVTGIMEKWPINSHFRGEVLASFESLSSFWRNYDDIVAGWRWNPNWTYIKLHPSANPDELEQLFPDFVTKYYTTDYIGENESVILHLQPLKDIWLYSELDGEIEPTGSIYYVYLFSAIAILILVIAAINFTNLSTAGAIQRAREVGLRKTLGANLNMLRIQFLSESFLYTIIAVALGVALAIFALPLFNQILDKSIELFQFGAGWLITSIIFIIIVTGFISGLYPAFVLSSFNPADSLRSASPKLGHTGFLRKSLVTFQFAITALLLIGTAIIYLQYNHIKEKNLGYNTEQIVILPSSNTWVLYDLDIYIDRLKQHPSVLNVSGSKSIMGSDQYSKYLITAEDNSDRELSMSKLIVTHEFIQTLGIELIAGRNFSEEFATDNEQALLVNRAAVEFLGWGSPADALGKFIDILGHRKRVVGVTEDFHYTFLKREIEPLIIELPLSLNATLVNINFIKVKLNPGNPESAISYMKEHWDDLDPAHPFEYYFYDEFKDSVYKTEQRMSEVVSILAILGIFVACMGLFGLASYSVYRRKREIGIRKAMGATAPGLFIMLSKDYLKLIVIANVIALPAAYYIGTNWLQNFPYRIDLLSVIPFIFVASLFVLLCISLLSISSQSIKAAVLDPVESLNR